MISALGILASGNDELVDALRRVLETLAKNQTPRGHIPSLAHDPNDRGASDTTPLFLMALALYRRVHRRERASSTRPPRRPCTWMEYQSPDDRVMVAQQPTSDWRDEQWVLGYGLYVNTLVYSYLRLFGQRRAGRAAAQDDEPLRHPGRPAQLARPRRAGRAAQALLRPLVLQDLQQRAVRPAGQQPGDPLRLRLALPRPTT